MKCKGTATLSRICRATNGKRTFQDARKELADLVIVREETVFRHKCYHRVVRVYLTAQGWAAANAMSPGWTPARLAPEQLKTWLRQLQNERDPWAMTLHEMEPRTYWKMVEDARKLAELRATNRIRPHAPKEMGSPKAVKGVMPEALKPHAFQPKPTIPTRTDHANDPYQPAPCTPPAEYNMPLTTAATARPLPEYDFARELADIQGRKLVGIGEPSRGFDNNPKLLDLAPTGETRVEVMARAHADGCVTQHAGLMFEGEEFGRDWKRFAVASKKKAG